MRKLPLDVRNKLAKAQRDLEWAVRMFHESVAPESVDIERLVGEIKSALVNAQIFCTKKK